MEWVAVDIFRWQTYPAKRVLMVMEVNKIFLCYANSLLSKINLLGQHLRVGHRYNQSFAHPKRRFCHHFLYPWPDPRGTFILDSIFRIQGAYSWNWGKSCPKCLFQAGAVR